MQPLYISLILIFTKKEKRKKKTVHPTIKFPVMKYAMRFVCRNLNIFMQKNYIDFSFLKTQISHMDNQSVENSIQISGKMAKIGNKI